MGKKEFLDEGLAQQLESYKFGILDALSNSNLAIDTKVKTIELLESSFKLGYNAGIFSYEELLKKLNVSMD